MLSCAGRKGKYTLSRQQVLWIFAAKFNIQRTIIELFVVLLCMGVLLTCVSMVMCVLGACRKQERMLDLLGLEF